MSFFPPTTNERVFVFECPGLKCDGVGVVFGELFGVCGFCWCLDEIKKKKHVVTCGNYFLW